uniref:Small ribosomal subunit protein eS24 n=1 Tax=uncultured marine group II/III euryarchaeote KM3_60_A11 TaxID=1456469 RepID=A0A075HGX4_9EURY|nr:ribosomal protein S24E (RP-S24e, RPS24) [uncultured marine group II/III euryarchaeote KM3_60_A11]
MEMEIAEKNDNPLLHRQEVQIVIRHENKGTPKRKEVIQSLSEQLKAKKDLIVIAHLKNKYGKTETQGYAKIYANAEALNRIETKPSIARQKPSEKKPPKAKKSKKEEKVKEETEPVEETTQKETPEKEAQGETTEKETPVEEEKSE